MKATICNECKKPLTGTGSELKNSGFSTGIAVKINGRDGSGGETLTANLRVRVVDANNLKARVDLCNECFRAMMKRIVGGL